MMWKVLTAASIAVALLSAPAVAQMAIFGAKNEASVDQKLGAGSDPNGIFADWDTDHNNRLSESEWKAGFDDNYDQKRFGTFSNWDVDQSGYLDQKEFGHGIVSSSDENKHQLWGPHEYGAYQKESWF